MNHFFKYVKRAYPLISKRPKGWQSLIYNTVLAKSKIVGPLMMPSHITIEPTNACNLQCPVCETGNGQMNRKKGLVDFEKYCEFIDEVAPTTSVLMFYFMGEPFLNKKAYEMIKYARQKGLYVETCTNGDFVNAEGVIYSDINDISFQLGGMTQINHQTYRIRGDLERTMSNIKEVVELRNKTPNSNVQISAGFIVMKHNEHEVPEFLKWAKDTGIDRANVIDPCVRTVDEGKIMLPSDKRYWYYDEEAFDRGVLKPKHLPDNECTWIWNSTTVTWEGDVVPCCRDPLVKNKLGNVFETPLKEIWNSEKALNFRREIVKNQSNVDICKLCSGYGVPVLQHEAPVGFEIKRLSMDERKLDIPTGYLD